MRRAIVWFRRDQRLSDNESLIRAFEKAGEIIPVYINSTYEQLENTGPCQTRQPSRARKAFLYQSLTELRASLQKRGSDLIYLEGEPAEILTRLCENYNCRYVFAQKLYTTFEKREEKACTGAGLNLVLSETYCLYSADFLPEKLPHVFGDFRSYMQKHAPVRNEFDIPKQIASPLLHHTEIPEYRKTDLTGVAFKAGESAACERLNDYFFHRKLLSNYKNTRNGLLGTDYSSRFSVWLANGNISPVTIYHKIKEYEKSIKKNQSTYWLYFELMWREFFLPVAENHGSKLFQSGGIKGIVRGPYEQELFDQWCQGKPGRRPVR